MAQPKSTTPKLCPIDGKPLGKNLYFCSRKCYDKSKHDNVGRPSKRTKEAADLVRQAALRMDAEDPAAIRLCANYAGIGETTLRDWLKDDDNFRAEFEKALSDLTMFALENRSKWVRQGDKNITSNYLKERAGRTQRLELTGLDGAPIQIEDTRAAELSNKFTLFILEETKRAK